MYGIILDDSEKWHLLSVEESLLNVQKSISLIINCIAGPYIIDENSILIYKNNFPCVKVIPEIYEEYTAKVVIDREKFNDFLLIPYLEEKYKSFLLQPLSLHGITIIPDDKTLNRLNNKIQAMRYRNDPAETCTWIGENGPVPLTVGQLEDLGMAANDQWQAIFDALPGIQADIVAGNITDTQGVDAALAAVGA